jgi:nucleotide-binding universal stress UspA family protein
VNLLGADALTAELERGLELAQAREARFASQCRTLEVASFESLLAQEEAERALVRLGRGSDLVVVGQPDPSEEDHALRAEAIAQIVQRNVRPTLVLPYAGSFEQIGQAPIVAWDDSREAARATADALPFLQRARIVQLVQFVPEGNAHASTDSSTLQPVVRWLERHGVKVQPRVCIAASDIGSALLSHAADTAADLIVMGAWGRARWAERILGGATRTLLASMTVPTLMSH